MEILVCLLSIFGLAFLIKESDGPFDLMLKMRSYLMRNQYVGVFFYKLFSCYMCVGTHCGWIIYLLYCKNYSLNLFIIWALAGGATSLILDKLLSRLYSQE
jgi:hypothetical protein